MKNKRRHRKDHNAADHFDILETHRYKHKVVLLFAEVGSKWNEEDNVDEHHLKSEKIKILHSVETRSKLVDFQFSKTISSYHRP